MQHLKMPNNALSQVALLAALMLAGCSDQPEVTNGEGLPVSQAPDAASGDAAALGDASSAQPGAAHGGVTDGGMGFSVPSDSRVCGTDLPFKPKGCACNVGQTFPCWTGPADKRNVRACRDGVQTCESSGEFAFWGECKGAVLECGEPPANPPEEEKCGCVPGQVIGCDEDCAALVFCAPFSTKVCQPDGTFGPCRESLLPSADSSLCINLFHGCLGENPDGLFIGDCSKPFTCGHPPGTPPATPPDPAVN